MTRLRIIAAAALAGASYAADTAATYTRSWDVNALGRQAGPPPAPPALFLGL
jgi:hypothetical protein